MAVSDPRAKLEAMALADRIAAIADDVDSKRDIPIDRPRQLAMLLNIGNRQRKFLSFLL
jgi:hypothetical protein